MSLTFVHRGTAVPFGYSSYNAFIFAYLPRLMQQMTDADKINDYLADILRLLCSELGYITFMTRGSPAEKRNGSCT